MRKSRHSSMRRMPALSRYQGSLQQSVLRFLKIVSAGLVLAFQAAAASPELTANEAGTQLQSPPWVPWVVTCSNAQSGVLSCQMEQNLVADKTGQLLLRAILFRRERDGKMVMELTLPHGIWLTYGVVVGIDGQSIGDRYEIEYADQNGSYASVPLDAPFLESMKRGNTLTVAMKTQRDKDFNLELSLDRFTDTFDSILTAMATDPGTNSNR